MWGRLDNTAPTFQIIVPAESSKFTAKHFQLKVTIAILTGSGHGIEK
jgi:hypothetical protein